MVIIYHLGWMEDFEGYHMVFRGTVWDQSSLEDKRGSIENQLNNRSLRVKLPDQEPITS